MGEDSKGANLYRTVAGIAVAVPMEVPGPVLPIDAGQMTPPQGSEEDTRHIGSPAKFIIAQIISSQKALPTPPPSPQSVNILPATSSAEETSEEQHQREQRRLEHLRNAIELRKAHYSRIAANKIATYIRQCAAWGYPIDFGEWLKAIPPPHMEFKKRDPSTYRRPQTAIESGLSRFFTKQKPRRTSLGSLDDAIIARIMGKLDYPSLQAFRSTSKRFNDIYEEEWEDICDEIFERMRQKISYVPDFFTPAGSPEEDSEDKLRQYHYCIDWIVETILPSFTEVKTGLVDAEIRKNEAGYMLAALNSKTRENEEDGGYMKSQNKYHNGNKNYESYRINGNETDQEDRAEEGEDAQTDIDDKNRGHATSFKAAQPKVAMHSTYPFPGLTKYILEKYLGSPRRSKDNLPRYQKSLTGWERAGLSDVTQERRAFHWAMELITWYLMKDRTVYYAIIKAFLKDGYEEDDYDDGENEEGGNEREAAVLNMCQREFVDRLKWLKPTQLWELVRLVEVKAKDVIALMKVKGFVGCDEEVNTRGCEMRLMEDFVLERVKQVFET